MPDGDLEGWWYSERGVEHFDDWVTHGLPHLVVLCTLEENVAYWVHVTADAVEPAGRGCKILVPADQTIDDHHADALLRVAATQRAAPALEGSVLWAGGGAVAPGRKLRSALVTPRLLAPHPNAGQDEAIDGFAGVALAAQGRFRDLKRFSEQHSSVPDLEDPGQGCDWVWSLMAAIWQWESSLRKGAARHFSPAHRTARPRCTSTGAVHPGNASTARIARHLGPRCGVAALFLR